MRRTDRERPNAWEALFAANFIFERTIIREKLRSRQRRGVLSGSGDDR